MKEIFPLSFGEDFFYSIKATKLEIFSNQHISHSRKYKINVVSIGSTSQMNVDVLVRIFVFVYKSLL